jgi:hypothetical protein
MTKNISIDSFDFILITALAGGFYTDNWLPFIVVAFIGSLSAI